MRVIRAAMMLTTAVMASDSTQSEEMTEFCTSNRGCSRIYTPVCGSDGVTYGNECEFKWASCTKKSLTKISDGECGEQRELRELKSDCPQGCYEIYKPVCGTDGKTYDNECFLQREACLTNTVIRKKHENACDEKVNAVHVRAIRGECPQFCVEVFEPVCGSDGHTYENKCTLEKDACVKKQKITIVKYGDCEGKLPVANAPVEECPEACLEILSPVCGSDGITYENECSMKREACRNHKKVTVKYIGDCESNADNDEDSDCPNACVEVLKPVCGTDGKTYDNECFLKREACTTNSRLSIEHQGDCEGLFPVGL